MGEQEEYSAVEMGAGLVALGQVMILSNAMPDEILNGDFYRADIISRMTKNGIDGDRAGVLYTHMQKELI